CQIRFDLLQFIPKLNAFAKQVSQQYHIPYWVMLPVAYSPVLLLLFAFPWLVVFALVLWLIIKFADSTTNGAQSEYDSLISEDSAEPHAKFVENVVQDDLEYEMYLDLLEQDESREV
ncbi:TPA: hypothetical protein ACPD29_002020, partial [Pasteurella multocida]